MDEPDTFTCPHCGAYGDVTGIAPELVPDKITCGFCLKNFTYRQTVWDRLRDELGGPQGVFFMRIIRKPPKGGPANPTVQEEQRLEAQAEVQEKARIAHLKKTPTRPLLDAYRDARHGSSVPEDAVIRWSGSRWSYTGAEVQAELNTREHIPNKREAKAIRRAKRKKSL